MPAFLQAPKLVTAFRLNRFASSALSSRRPTTSPARIFRAMATQIPPPAVNDRLKVESPPLYIDVRTPKEYTEGHVPSAVNVPVTLGPGAVVPTFVDDVKAVAGDRNLIIGCKSGKRSSMAIDLLQKAGFEGLIEMEGGFDAWAANTDLPVER